MVVTVGLVANFTAKDFHFYGMIINNLIHGFQVESESKKRIELSICIIQTNLFLSFLSLGLKQFILPRGDEVSLDSSYCTTNYRFITSTYNCFGGGFCRPQFSQTDRHLYLI